MQREDGERVASLCIPHPDLVDTSWRGDWVDHGSNALPIRGPRCRIEIVTRHLKAHQRLGRRRSSRSSSMTGGEQKQQRPNQCISKSLADRGPIHTHLLMETRIAVSKRIRCRREPSHRCSSTLHLSKSPHNRSCSVLKTLLKRYQTASFLTHNFSRLCEKRLLARYQQAEKDLFAVTNRIASDSVRNVLLLPL